MKLICILLFLSFTVNGQEFQGKATYKTHLKMDFKLDKGKEAPDEAIQELIKVKLKKQFQKTFTLNFTKSTSTYTQEAKLSAPQPSGGIEFKMIGNFGESDVLYKNITEKKFVSKREISGKRFLIKDALANIDWELTDETKNIGKYTCYKAIRKKEVERIKFDSFLKGGKEQEKEKVIIKTVAWYTPEIPVSNGPEKFWGLPGLILEIQEGKKTIVCSEIVMNPSEKIKIKIPKKGKEVTAKQFNEIMNKHSKESFERSKNKRKNKDGKSYSIQIQG